MAFPPTTTFTHTGTAVTTASLQIQAANSKRFYLIIQNQGGAAIYVRMDGGTATADKDSLMLLPGESYEPLNFVPASSITAIAVSGTVDVHVIEGAAP